MSERQQHECPNPGCNNTGIIPVQVGEDDWEPQQCEWCYTMPESVFNLKNRMEELERENQELRQKLKVHEDDASDVVQCGFALGMDNAKQEIAELRKDREYLNHMQANGASVNCLSCEAISHNKEYTCHYKDEVVIVYGRTVREVIAKGIKEADAAMSDKMNKTSDDD